MLRLLWLALLCICQVARSQTNPPPAPDPSYPSYLVSMGGGYTRNAQPQAAETWLSAAIRMGPTASPYYSITTLDMTTTTSTVRTGFAKVFAQSGNFTLLGRVDAGVSASSPVIGSFTGGAIIVYSLPKYQHLFLSGEVRIAGVSSTTASQPNQVTPGFYVGFGRSF